MKLDSSTTRVSSGTNVVIPSATSPTLAGALHAFAGPSPALVALERTLDYEALRVTVLGVSTWLVRQGMLPGSRVAIVQNDGPWSAVMLLGVCHAHAAVPLNPNLSAEEYAFATTDFEVAAVVAEHGVMAATRLHDVAAPVLFFSPWAIYPTGEETPTSASPDAPAFLLHTSGTTARPKKVVLTQERIWQSAHVIARSLQLGQGDRCLTGMPMFHVHGILNALASTLVSGGSFAHAGPFDTLGFYEHLKALRPTWITAVPTMYHALAARPELVPPAPGLRLLRSSSAPLPDVLAERLERLFGVSVLSSYGMTEIDPIACVRLGESPPRGAIGRPAELDVRLAGPSGEEIAPGAVGEVWVRGRRVIPAYEADADVNTKAFSNGWFRTGDLARRDDEGWLHLSGRIKEIINRSGEKVAPLEIDAVMLRHPDVIEAAAFGVPDPARGEDIAAAVVLRAGSTLSEHEFRAWMTERLAFHKCPRYVRFVSALPKGPTGKLLRSALRLAPGAVPAGQGDVALVQAVWAEVLELSDVQPDTRFLDVGGTSAAALDILICLEERLGRRLPVDVLLEGDTPAALAASLQRLPELPPNDSSS
jgi:acyl-CoA synthetase (AMP-forming)/AMP-acid ligase II/acyl carrier protein